MSSMSTSNVVNFPRVHFLGCPDNGKGIAYGHWMPDEKVPENYKDAVLALREFFAKNGIPGAMKVDVVYFDDGDPVISMGGYPGDALVSKNPGDGKFYDSSQEGSLLWKAIHEVIDPFNVNLNPYLRFARGMGSRDVGFYDASLM